MLMAEYEFKENGEFVEVWWENDRPPFNDILLGTLRKNNDGYYELHPSRKIVIQCKGLRLITQKVSALNTS